MLSLVSCFARGGGGQDPIPAKWFEEGEKPTRYFFRRENQRAAKNSFDSLLNSQGEETSSQTDMESILVDFIRICFQKIILICTYSKT